MLITTPVPHSSQSAVKGTSEGHFGRAVLIGLIPLALLIVTLGVTLIAITVIRPLISSTSFFEQQSILATTAILGLVLTTITYIFTCKHILQLIRAWHLAGHKTSVTGGLWALIITSVAVVLPVLLSFVLR